MREPGCATVAPLGETGRPLPRASGHSSRGRHAVGPAGRRHIPPAARQAKRKPSGDSRDQRRLYPWMETRPDGTSLRSAAQVREHGKDGPGGANVFEPTDQNPLVPRRGVTPRRPPQGRTRTDSSTSALPGLIGSWLFATLALRFCRTTSEETLTPRSGTKDVGPPSALGDKGGRARQDQPSAVTRRE